MSTPKDWYDPRHFAFMVAQKWQSLQLKAREGDMLSQMKVTGDMQELANNILRSKRYTLLYEYYESYIEGRASEITPLSMEFYYVFRELYRKVCQPKHKFLMGTKGNFPLWIDAPELAWLSQDLLAGKSKEEAVKIKLQNEALWNTAMSLATICFPILTGSGIQAEYDRLLVVQPHRWSPVLRPSKLELETFNERLGQVLGFGEPPEVDEVLQIQAYAMLEQRYKLVENRPVVIRLEENPVVREVVLMQKGTLLIARAETYKFGDLLQFLDLEDPSKLDGSLDFMAAWANFKPGQLNAMPALVASIYRDLVTIDEVAGGVRFTASAGRSSKKKEDEDEKPKTFTTSWQVIPRRLYTNRKGEADITVERTELNEHEKGFRQALRRYHAVVGHVRRFRDRPDFSASYERRQLADGDGIILKNGETYVKPHDRGLSAIEALGEVDLALVPHYLRRGRKE